MKLLPSKTEKIPLSKLPYGFQKRLIALAPLQILNDVGRVCSDVKMFRSFCPKAFDKVLITDNDSVYQEALKNSFSNRIFKVVRQFWWYKVINNIEGDVLEEDHAVLHVDEIFDRKLHIYVADTLLLNCSINAYKKVSPFITGPYTRLALNGRITWQQVKWIVHPDVTKVCIKAPIQIPGEFYDNFSDFLVKHVHDSDSSVALYNNVYLKTALQAACSRQKRHLHRHTEPSYLQVTTNFYFFVHFPKLFCVAFILSMVMALIGTAPIYLMLLLENLLTDP